ncbi:MAG: thaumatin family protein [Candidatus Binataceae bacterium]
MPPNNDWEIGVNSSVALCMPPSWNGRFWPRTECNFSGLFGNDAGYQSCSDDADCTANNTVNNPHICYGGKCMLTCNNGGASFCQGNGGLNNATAICAPVTQSTTSPTPKVCTYPQGVVCGTGDCLGLYQCYGTWGTNTALQTASGPVSIFEAAFTGTQTVNYDVSLVNGYNTQIKAAPSVPASGAACYQPGCTSDLNSSCPTNLQVTEAPSSTVSKISCGSGTYCQSGECVAGKCVIGCLDPGDQCQMSSPPAGLMCNNSLPSGETYEEMYLAKNTATGTAMSSGNQGNPTCWGDSDCLPGQTCEMPGKGGIPDSFPFGVGVCATNGVFSPQINCSSQSDVGKGCGGYSNLGYPNALGYTCISTGAGASDVACVPAYNPPVSGLGTQESVSGQPPLLTGVGSFINRDWLTAATQAGGGTTPYYETFAAACPNQYGFSYDDFAGDLQCLSNGPINFTLTFGSPLEPPPP